MLPLLVVFAPHVRGCLEIYSIPFPVKKNDPSFAVVSSPTKTTERNIKRGDHAEHALLRVEMGKGACALGLISADGNALRLKRPRRFTPIRTRLGWNGAHGKQGMFFTGGR